METVKKYLEHSPHKIFYEEMTAKLSSGQQIQLEELTIKLEKAGAENPLAWAFSEISENIPQFARFLVLKAVSDIFYSTRETALLADDMEKEGDFGRLYAEIESTAGEEKLDAFLKIYSKALAYRFIEILDEGNPHAARDGLSWMLAQTGGKATAGKAIQGLHEDFLEFNKPYR